MDRSRKVSSKIAWSLAILAAAAIGPYLGSINYEFTYDDHGQLEENTFLRNPAHVWDVLTFQTLAKTEIINGRRPVVLVSYFIDRALWGENPAGYRVTNLLFHTGVIWLVFFFLRRLAYLRDPDGRHNAFALLGALLFGLHPVLTEAVHPPAFRPDVFYTFFTLGYLLIAVYLPAARAGRRILAAFGALLVLIFALGSKEAAVIAPAVLVGVWICFPSARPQRKTMLVFAGASILIVTAFCALCASGDSFQAVSGAWNGLSLRRPANLYTAPWLWFRYLFILAVPYPLIVDRIVEPVTGPAAVRFIVGMLMFAASVLFFLVAFKKHPWWRLGVGWMLAGFLPVSNIVPLFNPLADRYFYFIAIGWGILLARALAWHGLEREGWSARMRVALLGVLCTAYVVISVTRLWDWRDDYTLWRHTLTDEPRSARAHTWVGLHFKEQERLKEALLYFSAATRLNPRDVTPLINRAIIFGEIGDLPAAERNLRLALERRPDKVSAHWNLSVALQLQGREEEALAEIEEALRLDPLHMEALRGKLALMVARGRCEDAMSAAEQMLEIEPDNIEAQSTVKWIPTLR